jgi:hypothetical protein
METTLNYTECSTELIQLDNRWGGNLFFQTLSTLQGVLHHEVHFLLLKEQLRT